MVLYFYSHVEIRSKRNRRWLHVKTLTKDNVITSYEVFLDINLSFWSNISSNFQCQIKAWAWGAAAQGDQIEKVLLQYFEFEEQTPSLQTTKRALAFMTK